MDELVYNALSQYFGVLQKVGYYKYADVYKVLILTFYKNYIYNDYRGLISKEDYQYIERALECLYGSTCLIPYPDYVAMGDLELGKISELAQRVTTLENTSVVKIVENTTSSESDIMIVED